MTVAKLKRHENLSDHGWIGLVRIAPLRQSETCDRDLQYVLRIGVNFLRQKPIFSDRAGYCCIDRRLGRLAGSLIEDR